VLSGLEEIKVCVAYEYEGKKLEDYPADTWMLSQVKPLYRTFKGLARIPAG